MSTFNDNNQPPPYRDDDEMQYTHFADFESRSDLQQFPSQIHPHPHPYPLFTRQENMNNTANRSLGPHVLTSHHSVYHSPSPSAAVQYQQHPHNHESPHGWPPYQHVSQPFSQPNPRGGYVPPAFPSPSPFPPRRLSPPPLHQPHHYKGQGLGADPLHANLGLTTTNHRLTLAGSLDPATGIFYRTPEHPRLRTAQACEKCRTRKAKCSGEHPSCKRCITRGLVCEYAKEGRVRGPNKPKSNKSGAGGSTSSANLHNSPNILFSSTAASRGPSGSGRTSSQARTRTSSAHSSDASGGSSGHISERRLNPCIIGNALVGAGHVDGPLISGPSGFSSAPITGRSSSRRNSLSVSDSRSSRPRLPDLQLDAASNLYRLSSADASGSGMRDVSPLDDMFLYPHPDQHHPHQPYQQQTHREAFSGAQVDHPSHPTHYLGQQHDPRLHHLQQHHVLARPREMAHALPQSDYHLGMLPQDGNVAMHSTQAHSLVNLNVAGIGAGFAVEEEEFVCPSPETYLHQQHRQQQSQAQLSHEEGTFEEHDHRLEDQNDCRNLPGSRTLTMALTPTSSSCFSSPRTSVSGSTGTGPTIGSPVVGTLSSSGSSGVMTTDYSQHQSSQPRLQGNCGLEFVLDPQLCDVSRSGVSVDGSNGGRVEPESDDTVHAHGSQHYPANDSLF